MRVLLSISTLFFFLLQGCVALQNKKQTDQAVVPVDNLKSVEFYDKEYTSAVEQEFQAIQKREEIEAKLIQSKVDLVSEYLTKADKIISNPDSNPSIATEPAIETLLSVKQWDDRDSRIAQQLDIYRSDDAFLKENLLEFQRQFDDYKYETALTTLMGVISLRPNNHQVQAQKRLTADLNSLYGSMMQDLSFGNLQQAYTTSQTIEKMLPAHINFDESSASIQLMQSIIDKGDKLARQKKYAAAVSFLSGFDFPHLHQQISDIKLMGTQAFQSRAITEQNRGNVFMSYLLINKALSFMGDGQQVDTAANASGLNAGLFNLHKESTDYVDKSIQAHIAISSFDSPSHDPDAGLQFSDSLTSFLYDTLPYGINILERDKIDSIIREQNQVNDANIGKVLGADLFVSGRVSLFKIETSEDIRNANVKIVTGEQVVPNPIYTQMFTQYGADQSAWPSIPAATVINKSYQNVKYNKGTARLKGYAKVSVRIMDTEKGKITFVKDYPASIEDVSEFQDEVREANIEYIPKKLISENEAKDSMRTEIVSEIGKVVLSSFDSREKRFLNKARYHVERREDREAIEPLAQGLLYCLKDGIQSDDSSYIEIQSLIDSIIE